MLYSCLHMCAQSFSTLIYSVALLRVSPGREWLAAFFRNTLPLLPSFNDQAISNTLWALARLRLAPGTNTSSRDWEKELYRVLCSKLPTFSSQVCTIAEGTISKGRTTFAFGRHTFHPAVSKHLIHAKLVP